MAAEMLQSQSCAYAEGGGLSPWLSSPGLLSHGNATGGAGPISSALPLSSVSSTLLLHL